MVVKLGDEIDLNMPSAMSLFLGAWEPYGRVPTYETRFIILKKWESLFSSIPQIVDRLETLAPLHSLAGRVGASLIALEKSHQQITAQLDRTEGIIFATVITTDIATVRSLRITNYGF